MKPESVVPSASGREFLLRRRGLSRRAACGIIPIMSASGAQPNEVPDPALVHRDARWARILSPALLAVIFLLDLAVPLGVAVPALYVVPPLLFIRAGRYWEPLAAAAGATVLTIAGVNLGASGGSAEVGLINRPLEVLIVWIGAGVVAYHRVTISRWARQLVRERHALEQSVVRLEELRQALDQAAIVATTDHRGIITDVNDKFCEISKYSREELLGRDHRMINSGFHSKEFMRDLWRTIARGRVWRGEIRNRAKDGSYYWVDTTIVPFMDGAGKPRQYLAIRSEITQRKAAEAQLAQQAALTQLGQLAAVVAHEVRNPLAGLRGSLEVLRPRISATPKEQEIIQAMIERIDTLNAKVNDLLRFARPQTPVLRPFELAPLVREAILSAQAATGAECPAIDFTPVPVVVRADPEMLRAALLNLLLNACQAGGSSVEVTTSVEGDRCRIAVLDRGSGIPEPMLERVFEAFYTTKKAGTGLGLPIVKRLVHLQDGTIELRRREGGGTIVELTIPLARQPARLSADGV
jgi:PAS domain S-box-containing protein